MIDYLKSLRVVYQTGKEDNAKDEEEDQECEFLGGGLEGVNEYAKTRRVSRQLEES